MAITIRDIDNHQLMLSQLKELTELPTMSKSLIQGGYLALQYHQLYQQQQEENQKLCSELESLRAKVDGFVDAFEALKRR